MTEKIRMRSREKSVEPVDSKELDDRSASSRIRFAAELEDICRRYSTAVENPELVDMVTLDYIDDDYEDDLFSFDEVSDGTSVTLSDEESIVSCSSSEEYEGSDDRFLDRDKYITSGNSTKSALAQAAIRLMPNLWNSVRDLNEGDQPCPLIRLTSPQSTLTSRSTSLSQPKRNNVVPNFEAEQGHEGNGKSKLNETFVVQGKSPLCNKGTTVCLSNGRFFLDALQQHHKRDDLQKAFTPATKYRTPRKLVTFNQAQSDIEETSDDQKPQTAMAEKGAGKFTQTREYFNELPEKATSNNSHGIYRTPASKVSHNIYRSPDSIRSRDLHRTPSKSSKQRQTADYKSVAKQNPGTIIEKQVDEAVHSNRHTATYHHYFKTDSTVNVTEYSKCGAETIKSTTKNTLYEYHGQASSHNANDVDNTLHKNSCGRRYLTAEIQQAVERSPKISDLKKVSSAEPKSKSFSRISHCYLNTDSKVNVKCNRSDKFKLVYGTNQELPLKDMYAKHRVTSLKDKFDKRTDPVQPNYYGSVGGTMLKCDDGDDSQQAEDVQLVDFYKPNGDHTRYKSSCARRCLSGEMQLADKKSAVTSSGQQWEGVEWRDTNCSGTRCFDVIHKESENVRACNKTLVQPFQGMLEKEAKRTPNDRYDVGAVQQQKCYNSVTDDSSQYDDSARNMLVDSFDYDSLDEFTEQNDDEVLLVDLWEPNVLHIKEPVIHKERTNKLSFSKKHSPVKKYPYNYLQHNSSDTNIKSFKHGFASPPSVHYADKHEVYKTFGGSPSSILTSPVRKLEICSSNKKIDFYKKTQVVWKKC